MSVSQVVSRPSPYFCSALDRPFLIAEIGLNHNGQLDLARRMADAAREAGADAAKFQIYRAGEFIAGKATLGDGGPGSLRDFFAQFELTETEWRRLAEHVRGLGLEFFASVFDGPSLELYCSLDCRLIKIASSDLDNPRNYERALSGPWEILLATGASREAEVAAALAAIPEARALAVMECVSRYPAPAENYNLSTLRRFAAKFGVAVGLSDHSEGNAIAAAATALGACCIEKHFTIDRSLPGPDHGISQDPAMFAAMARDVRAVASAIVERPKVSQSEEEGVRRFGRRGLYARRDLAAGETIDETNSIDLRPLEGAAPAAQWSEWKGKPLAQSCREGEGLPS